MESIFSIGPYTILNSGGLTKGVLFHPSPNRVPREVFMDQPFDIFRKEVGGRFVWCGAAKSLAEANATVKRLDDSSTEFIIVNEDTGERTFIPRSEPSHKSAT